MSGLWLAAVDVPRCFVYAICVWGALKGTHAHHATGYGPHLGRFIAVHKHLYSKFIYPGAQRDFLVTWGIIIGCSISNYEASDEDG